MYHVLAVGVDDPDTVAAEIGAWRAPRDSVETHRLRRDPEDHALGRDRRVVVVLAAVLPRERVDVGASLGPAHRLDDLAAHLGVRVRVAPLPDRDRHARVALDRPELRAVRLRVDQDVVGVGVDPHDVGHRPTGAKDHAEGCEVRRLCELAHPRVEGSGHSAAVRRLVGVDAVGERARHLQPELRQRVEEGHEVAA